MRIRKVSQSIPIKAKVVNSYSESEEETYSCDYVNEHKQDKLIAGTGIEITGENIINNIQGNYSTKEVKIGTWTNGNNLYRKIFFINLNNTTDGTWTNTVSEKICDNINLRFIEYAFINVEQSRYNLPYYSNNGYGIKGFTNGKGGITIAHNNSIYNNLTVACSVLYTKTTD